MLNKAKPEHTCNQTVYNTYNCDHSDELNKIFGEINGAFKIVGDNFNSISKEINRQKSERYNDHSAVTHFKHMHKSLESEIYREKERVNRILRLQSIALVLVSLGVMFLGISQLG